MDLRKVSVCDRDVIRRRRVQTNTIVSYWREEFDSDGNVVQIARRNQKPKPNFGVSKLEDVISKRYLVDSFRGEVTGG